MADEYSFQASGVPQGNIFDFQTRQFTYLPDNNNGSYPNGSIVFDGAAISNSGRWMAANQSYLAIPLVLHVSAANGVMSARNAELALAASLKNGYHQLINSIALEVTNNSVVNLTQFSNLDINYRLLTSMSQEDVNNFGPSIGFYKDTAESMDYSSVASSKGLGEINNSIAATAFQPLNGWGSYFTSNMGRAMRMINNTSYDPVGNVAQGFFTSTTACNATSKNYVSVLPASGGVQNVVYYIMATIPLKIMHQVFDKMPLVRGAYWRMVVNLNTNCTTTLNITQRAANSAPTYTSVSTQSFNNVLPFMVSPLGSGSTTVGNTGLSVAETAQNSSITVSLGIARSYTTPNTFAHNSFTQARLYACLYEMTPMYEELYLKTNPVKEIHYTDILSFQVPAVAPGGNFSQLLTNGVSRMRYLLIHPMMAPSANGTTAAPGANWTTPATQALGLTSPQNSPFSSCPGTCAPSCAIGNFNVLVSGSAIYQSNYVYKFEHFLQEIRGSNSINGGVPLSLSSGLISQSEWETGYGWIYVDLSRRASQSNDDISRSLQIIGTNASNYAIELYCIVGYERQISISTGTGSLVI